MTSSRIENGSITSHPRWQRSSMETSPQRTTSTSITDLTRSWRMTWSWSWRSSISRSTWKTLTRRMQRSIAPLAVANSANSRRSGAWDNSTSLSSRAKVRSQQLALGTIQSSLRKRPTIKKIESIPLTIYLKPWIKLTEVYHDLQLRHFQINMKKSIKLLKLYHTGSSQVCSKGTEF